MGDIIDYSMGNLRFYNAFYIDEYANKDDGIQRIVLNPEVAYEFDKRNIRYAKLEDYYSEREFFKNAPLFLEIDTYICHSLYDIFAENDIGLERDEYLIFFYYIKTHVESLFVRFYIYRELFDRLDRVAEVTYYCVEDGEDDSDYMALEYFSKLCAFKLERKIVRCWTQPKFHTSTLQIKLDFISHLFNKIGILIVQSIKCLKVFHKWALNCKGDVLFLSDSHSLSELAHIKARQGYRTWFCNREATLIELRGSYFKKRITGIGTFNKLKVNSQQIDDVANYISYRLGLIDAYWVTRRLRKVIELLIQPSLGKYFFLKDNPRLVNRFKEIISDGYYINYHNSFFLYFYKFKRGTTRTFVRHGDDPWRANGVKYLELLFANNYICEKTGSELLLREIAKTWKWQVEFDTQGLLFNAYRKLKVKRKKKLPPRIIYLPTFFSGNKFRRLDGVQYPATWYYTLQKKIIDSFIHEKSFIFVWKGFSQMGGYAAVLDRYISDISAINVRFSFKILAEEIKNAYVLITDFPGTGMYEAAFAGCPVFGVYPDWFPINKYALEFWGKCLKSYSHEDEVVQYFKEFIYSKDIQTYHPIEFTLARKF